MRRPLAVNPPPLGGFGAASHPEKDSNPGADVPKTRQDRNDQLAVISDSGVYGLSSGADAGWPLTDWFENAYCVPLAVTSSTSWPPMRAAS